MKLFTFILFLAAILPACSKSQYKAAQINAPNRQQQQSPSSCPPTWNNVFIGQTSRLQKVIQLQRNLKQQLILSENNVNEWMIDGKGRNIDHVTSYSAICASLPLLASTDADPLNGNGIDIQIFHGTQQISTIRYVENTQADPNGFAFDYIVLKADGSVDKTASDTYKLRTK